MIALNDIASPPLIIRRCKCGRIRGEDPKTGQPVWLFPPPCFTPKAGAVVVFVVCPACRKHKK
jgi:hypothetical protein